VLYNELRALANQHLRAEGAAHTLQATALVHEAYLRLVGDPEAEWANRTHFLGAAATAIRRVLVDHSRRRGRMKRGGRQCRVALDEAAVVATEPDVNLLALDEALDRLAVNDAQKARVVELRFFGGLTAEETATVIGVSARTVARDWRFARSWLRREIAREGADDE
jgi:RNA polymerase sigma factor (TIGR02999 family)